MLREAVNATAAMTPASQPAAVAGELPDAETAFERAYESEFPRVYGYVRYRVGNADTADDLTSQAFLRALDRLATFDPRRGELGPWILGIARNVTGLGESHVGVIVYRAIGRLRARLEGGEVRRA